MIDITNAGIDAITLTNLGVKEFSKDKTKDFMSFINTFPLNDNKKDCNELVNSDTGQVLKIRSMPFYFYRYHEFPGLNSILFRYYNYNPKYNSLHSTLPSVLYGNNIRNINTTKYLKKAIQQIDSYLNELGFKGHDLFNSELKEIELNMNIKLSGPFINYKRAIDFIFRNMNKDDSVSPYNRGFKISTSNLDIKLYDKRYQMENIKNTVCHDEVLRIEVTFKSFSDRKNLKDIKSVNDLIYNNGLEILQKEFFNVIEKYIYRDTLKAIELQYKDCIKWIKKGTTSNITTKLQLPLMKGNQLIDVILLMEALRETEHKKNYGKYYKQAVQLAKLGDDHTILFGNLSLLNEIYRKLGFDIYKPNLTDPAFKYIQSIENKLFSFDNTDMFK